MKQGIRFIALLMCLVFSVGCAGCSKAEDSSTAKALKYSDVKVSSTYDSDGLVCENSNWKLMWDDEKNQVSFVEKNTGYRWSPTPDTAQTIVYDEDGMPIKNNPQLESAILVSYYDPSTLLEKEIMSSTDVFDVYLQEIDSGIRVIYDFSDHEILIPVEYTIDEKCFRISVNLKQIVDNGENYVTTVSLAPFMCGVKNNTKDSWIFMPDGSGAVYTVNSFDVVGKFGSKAVYGDDLTNQKFNYLSKTEQFLMPVYGLKTGNKALFSIIESGAEQAELCWNIGSQNIGYSGVYSKFKVRGYSTIKTPKGFSSFMDAKEVKYFYKASSKNKISVAYYSLSGKNADLNGMAKIYRDYLIKEKGLTEKSGETLASYKFIGAVEQPDFVLGIPTKKIYSLTTVKQAEKIVSELTELMGNDLSIDLVGFGKNGLDVGTICGGYSVSGKLGGNKEMKKLADSLKQNSIDYFMDFDLISYSKSGSGISKTDSAVFPNLQNAWFTDFNIVTRETNDKRFYILSRSKLETVMQKLLDKTKKIGISGISLDSLSNTVYSDYSNEATGNSGGMTEQVKGIILSAKKRGFRVLSTAANDYAAIVSDKIIDAPIYSSDYDVTLMDVPFYQMIFKGYIPMSSVSVNLCADSSDAILRCVEAGISPTYTLTNNYDNELITSNHSFLYGTNYQGIKESILEFSSEYKDYFESIKGAKISDYEILSDDVRAVYFDNGVYAVVNYSDKESKTSFGTVSPNSYITGKRVQ